MNLVSICKSAKKSSLIVSALSHSKRNKILNDLSKNLEKNKSHIFKSNSKDLNSNKTLSMEIKDRLIINEEKTRQIEGIELIASENFTSDNVMKATGSVLTRMPILTSSPSL